MDEQLGCALRSLDVWLCSRPSGSSSTRRHPGSLRTRHTGFWTLFEWTSVEHAVQGIWAMGFHEFWNILNIFHHFYVFLDVSRGIMSYPGLQDEQLAFLRAVRDIVGGHQCCPCAVDCPWVRRLADNRRYRKGWPAWPCHDNNERSWKATQDLFVQVARRFKHLSALYMFISLMHLLTRAGHVSETHARKPQEFRMFLYFDSQVPLFDAVCNEECNARFLVYIFYLTECRQRGSSAPHRMGRCNKNKQVSYNVYSIPKLALP